MVAMREDPQQQIGTGLGILRALQHEGGTPARIERLADRGLARGEIEALPVPLQHGVAANDPLLLGRVIRPPLVGTGMLTLAHRRRTRVHRDPLEDVGVLALRTLGIRFSMKLRPTRAEVIEEHVESMTGRTVDVRGARVRIVEAGPNAGEAVLLIHGVGGWAENWRETVSAIARRGYRAHAIDLPGFGESERPRGARYFDPRRPFYAQFVVDVLDALGCARAHLVGHSLGGAVAFTAAVTAPERTSSLTLVAPGGIGIEVALALRLATLPGARLMAWLRGPRAAREGVASCFYDVARVPQTVWEEADRFVPGSLGETIRVLRAGVTLRGIRPSLRSAWVAHANRYTGPVLVVWGERDAVIPATQAHAVAEIFPHAEVRLIPDAGHLVMIEQPEGFQSALIPFLDRIAASLPPASLRSTGATAPARAGAR